MTKTLTQARMSPTMPSRVPPRGPRWMPARMSPQMPPRGPRWMPAWIPPSTQRWLVGVIAAGCLAGLPSRAHAEPATSGDAVALLPLDTDRSLAIYGQPVANELARALVGDNVAVVVVGPKMAVPDRARLIIDGTIVLGKASAVTISIRIRNTLDGLVLETLSATAPGLAKIDGAAAELAGRVVPSVRDKLLALHRQVPVPPAPDDHGHGHVVQTATPAAPPAAPAAFRPLLVALADTTRAPSGALLLGALDAAVAEWTHAHHRQIGKLDPGKLDPKLAPKVVADGAADRAIGFWILDYEPEAGALPMARARVRVRIADASAILFDRVVVTDTVLGEKGLPPPELAARVAREVLAILRPHMRRHVALWE
jgi:hypothetical protein